MESFSDERAAKLARTGIKTEQIVPHREPTLADQATLINVRMQRDMLDWVSSTKNLLVMSGTILSTYFLLVGVFATLFIVRPLQTARWLGLIDESETTQVLGAKTDAINIPSLFVPISRVSLGIVKSLNPDSYAQVAKVAVLDAANLLALDTGGSIVPVRPIVLSDSSLLQIKSNELIANLNAALVQGRQPGTNPGDIAIVGQSAIPVPTAITINTSGLLSGGGSVVPGGTLTLSCPTCTAFGSETATAGNLLIADGQNWATKALSGDATLSSNGVLALVNTGTTGVYGSANLIPVLTTDAQGRVTSVANTTISPLTLAGNSGSGLVSLGGTLTLTGAGITNIVPSGSNFTLTTTEADTLASVATRGAVTNTNLILNGGIGTTTSSLGFTVGSTSTSGRVQVGSSGTSTPDLLVLDNGTSDPTGVNGGIYYNTSTGKFRCFENNIWANCIPTVSTGSDLQHASSYDTNEAMTNIPTGGAQVTLGTVSVTPSSAMGDIYVTGWVDSYSSNATDQPLGVVIETTSNCTGSTVGNAGVTYTITSGASTANVRGTIRVSGIAVDPGVSAQPYSLCAAVTSGGGDSDIMNWGIEAMVIDTGADLAEIYTTNDTTLQPGDVVTHDSALKTGMKKSQTAYDPGLLGIISTKPGLIIGGVDKEGATAMPIALIGRVPVKVNSENGNIAVGDFLTSSSTPGVAMKATRPGPTIGMALSEFSGDGVGMVLAFIKSVPLTNNAAGHAYIKAGETETGVRFENDYARSPAVTVSINMSSEVGLEEMPNYAVFDLSGKSFKIKLAKPAAFDLDFSWIAL